MRKLIFFGAIALGALVGMLWAINDDWGTRVVMAGVGALFGTAMGGAATGRGSGGRRRLKLDDGVPASWSDELAANFWRDRGHPPFTKPWDALPDRHMLDPDKVE
ncbi:hypothetical protein [Aquabacterium humicola]|uniref:hypothetical protein n=1 Tax=Aquabacterium humicola TaxID=3237377 RepID=UPI00254376E1|nr:hypothetical protein [Rubrivivax pictus]